MTNQLLLLIGVTVSLAAFALVFLKWTQRRERQQADLLGKNRLAHPYELYSLMPARPRNRYPFNALDVHALNTHNAPSPQSTIGTILPIPEGHMPLARSNTHTMRDALPTEDTVEAAAIAIIKNHQQRLQAEKARRVQQHADQQARAQRVKELHKYTSTQKNREG